MSRQVVTKAEFAALCGVDASAISRWIGGGKIKGAALVGDGRGARIDVEEARRQLRITLDSGQRLGNGLGTNLVRQPEPAAEPAPRESFAAPAAEVLTADVGDDALDAGIKRAKLEQLLRANRRAEIEEAAEQGLYTETAASRRQLGVVAAQVLRVFEGAIPELSTGFAARFGADEREVTLFLVEQFRRIRADASEKAQAAAAKLDAVLPDSEVSEG